MSKQTLRVPLVLTVLLFPAIHLFAASNSVPANPAKTSRSAPLSAALQGIPRYAPDRLLVKFRPGTAVSERGKAHRQAGGKQLRVIPGTGVHIVEVPAGSVPGKISRYQKNPNIEYAEPDFYRVLVLPDEGNDPGPSAGGIIASRAALGLVTLTNEQLARGNVAPLVGGKPASAPDDEFNVADLLLITGKATGSISY